MGRADIAVVEYVLIVSRSRHAGALIGYAVAVADSLPLCIVETADLVQL